MVSGEEIVNFSTGSDLFCSFHIILPTGKVDCSVTEKAVRVPFAVNFWSRIAFIEFFFNRSTCIIVIVAVSAVVNSGDNSHCDSLSFCWDVQWGRAESVEVHN